MIALLSRILGRIPIGWLQLTHNRTRLAAAVAGVSFANILIFVQLGIMSSFSDSTRISYRAIAGDILISADDSNSLFDGSNVPRQLGTRALSEPGVASMMPIYLGAASWTQDDGDSVVFQAFGIDPSRTDFLGTDIKNTRPLLRADTALLDRSARGLAPDKLAGVSERSPVTFEALGRKINVIGTVSIGGGFSADGYMVVSDQTFMRIFPHRSSGAPNHILLRVESGADLEHVAEALDTRFTNSHVQVRSLPTAIEQDVIYQTTKRPTGLIFGFGVFMGVIVGMVIVYQVLSTDVADHIREYATFKAMGYSQRFLLGIIFEEAVILAISGFVPGFLVSTAIYTVLADATGLPIAMSLGRAGMVFTGTLLCCAISGAIATKRLSSADPADLF